MKKEHNISFRLVAYTDAAGKYSPDAIRGGNEDNFFVDDDLSDSIPSSVSQDEVLQLGSLGMLMAVADGMGGMNAGEVASQIAIDTVKAAFRKESLTESVVATSQSRQKYLEDVIKVADKNIKSEARKDRNKEGMGSTIILAWLYNDDLSISWCGDSRAYIFNDNSGIRLISQDHSYVQELVNKGLLTYEQTFDHPQNNIITRSLGDPTKEAKPESKTLKVGKGDVILLCSDGLSGVLRDRKTYDLNGRLLPEENLEDIISTHTSSMKECREALWEAAEREGWYDNVTAILCQILEGPISIWGADNIPSPDIPKKRTKLKWIVTVALLLVIIAIGVAFLLGERRGSVITEETILTDTIVTPSASVSDSALKEEVKAESIKVANPEASSSEVSTVVKESVETQKSSGKAQKEDQKSEKGKSLQQPSELTKINKGDKEKDTDTGVTDELTPIKDNNKKERIENPSNP